MKILSLQTGAVAGLSLLSFTAFAGSLTVPNDFVSGTPAVAADVNANFTEIETQVNDNNTRITSNTTANTTHSTSDGKDHSDVGLNNTHRSSNGADHSDVGLNNTHRSSNGTDHSDVGLNNTHRSSNGTDHLNVVTNAAAIANLQNPTGVTCVGTDASDVMVRVGPLCVDRYEASVWDTIAGSAATGPIRYGIGDNYPCNDDANNCTSTNSIFARSEANVIPSTNITWFQAQQACASSGKRLLTNAEWQMAVAGTADVGDSDGTGGTCNTGDGFGSAGAIRITGGATTCISNWNVEDMIGNVYEIVADWIQGSGTDVTNVAVGTFSSNTTATVANAAYGDSELVGFNSVPGGNRTNAMPAAILRGGAFNSITDAGAFAMRADFSPDFAGNSVIGFRCAR